jgi:fatty acid-binding protein DegV
MVGLLFEWTIIDLVEKNKKGELNAEAVQAYLDVIKKSREGILVVSDMTQLKKGGRVRGFKSLMIKILKLSIIISFDYDGLSFANIGKKPEEIVKKMIEVFDKKIDLKSSQINRALVFKNKHTDLDKNMSEISRIFKAKYPNVKFEEAEMPSVIVAHTGYNYIAIGFDTKK